MQKIYPVDPHFGAYGGAASSSEEGLRGMVEPSVFEAEGRFYSLSTGNDERNCYDIRISTDLIHWSRAGTAPVEGLSALKCALAALCGASQEEFFLRSPFVRADERGGFCLYGSLCAADGRRAALFLARSERAEGPYVFVGELVLTDGRGSKTPAALDASVFSDGGRLYLVYGRGAGGVRLLELDADSGLRADGRTRTAFDGGECAREDDYYGIRLLRVSDASAPAVIVADVPVYPRGFAFGRDRGKPVRVRECHLVATVGNSLRVWTAPAARKLRPAGGGGGVKLCGACARTDEDSVEGFSSFSRGRVLHTSDGRDLLLCNASPCSEEEGGADGAERTDLFPALLAFNADGAPVVSLNRYAGERMRPVGSEELAGTAFDFVRLSRGEGCAHAREGLLLEEDGTVTVEKRRCGRWKCFGENYVDIELEGEFYRGVAMPAEACGVTVSALSGQGLPLFLRRAHLARDNNINIK